MIVVLDNAEQIAEFRLRTLHKMLKLEIAGMTRRGQSAYSIIKQETGLKGSRQKIYDELSEYFQLQKELNRSRN